LSALFLLFFSAFLGRTLRLSWPYRRLKRQRLSYQVNRLKTAGSIPILGKTAVRWLGTSDSTMKQGLVYFRAEEGGIMGGFLFGLIVGIVGTLAFVIYDEGEYFLRLHAGVKRTMQRYKQQAG
jgi:hypothetical protein